MAEQKKTGAKTDKPKRVKKEGDAATRGFGTTLRSKAGTTMRIQTKFRGDKLQSSITHVTRDAEGKKVRKIGARATHDDRASAEAWQSQAKSKLLGLGWQEKGSKGTKADAFDLESLPAPDAPEAEAAQ
jgi:hypothetical protein